MQKKKEDQFIIIIINISYIIQTKKFIEQKHGKIKKQIKQKKNKKIQKSQTIKKKKNLKTILIDRHR